jgi:hypothetical protein
MSLTLLATLLGAAIAGLLATQIWLLWRLLRMRGTATRLEEKLTHFGDALSLLTETSEAGFRAIADELTRRHAAEAPAGPRPRPSLARMKAAARRGSSIAEIAAAESMSEGEVRLRLHLADKAASAGGGGRAARSRKEAGDALRA